MKCIKCGVELPENAAFCHVCGTTQHDDNQAVKCIEMLLKKKTGFGFSKQGRLDCERWIGEFGFQEVQEGVLISIQQYMAFDQDGAPIKSAVEEVFSKIGGICANRRRQAECPYERDMQKFLAYSDRKWHFTAWQKSNYKADLFWIFRALNQYADCSELTEGLFLCLKKAETYDKAEFCDEIHALTQAPNGDAVVDFINCHLGGAA